MTASRVACVGSDDPADSRNARSRQPGVSARSASTSIGSEVMPRACQAPRQEPAAGTAPVTTHALGGMQRLRERPHQVAAEHVGVPVVQPGASGSQVVRAELAMEARQPVPRRVGFGVVGVVQVVVEEQQPPERVRADHGTPGARLDREVLDEGAHVGETETEVAEADREHPHRHVAHSADEPEGHDHAHGVAEPRAPQATVERRRAHRVDQRADDHHARPHEHAPEHGAVRPEHPAPQRVGPLPRVGVDVERLGVDAGHRELDAVVQAMGVAVRRVRQPGDGRQDHQRLVHELVRRRVTVQHLVQHRHVQAAEQREQHDRHRPGQPVVPHHERHQRHVERPDQTQRRPLDVLRHPLCGVTIRSGDARRGHF